MTTRASWSPCRGMFSQQSPSPSGTPVAEDAARHAAESRTALRRRSQARRAILPRRTRESFSRAARTNVRDDKGQLGKDAWLSACSPPEKLAGLTGPGISPGLFFGPQGNSSTTAMTCAACSCRCARPICRDCHDAARTASSSVRAGRDRSRSFRATCNVGLESRISKRLDRPNRGGRWPHRGKVKSRPLSSARGTLSDNRAKP